MTRFTDNDPQPQDVRVRIEIRSQRHKHLNSHPKDVMYLSRTAGTSWQRKLARIACVCACATSGGCLGVQAHFVTHAGAGPHGSDSTFSAAPKQNSQNRPCPHSKPCANGRSCPDCKQGNNGPSRPESKQCTDGPPRPECKQSADDAPRPDCKQSASGPARPGSDTKHGSDSPPCAGRTQCDHGPRCLSSKACTRNPRCPTNNRGVRGRPCTGAHRCGPGCTNSSAPHPASVVGPVGGCHAGSPLLGPPPGSGGPSDTGVIAPHAKYHAVPTQPVFSQRAAWIPLSPPTVPRTGMPPSPFPPTDAKPLLPTQEGDSVKTSEPRPPVESSQPTELPEPTTGRVEELPEPTPAVRPENSNGGTQEGLEAQKASQPRRTPAKPSAAQSRLRSIVVRGLPQRKPSLRR